MGGARLAIETGSLFTITISSWQDPTNRRQEDCGMVGHESHTASQTAGWRLRRGSRVGHPGHFERTRANGRRGGQDAPIGRQARGSGVFGCRIGLSCHGMRAFFERRSTSAHSVLHIARSPSGRLSRASLSRTLARSVSSRQCSSVPAMACRCLWLLAESRRPDHALSSASSQARAWLRNLARSASVSGFSACPVVSCWAARALRRPTRHRLSCRRRSSSTWESPPWRATGSSLSSMMM